MLRQCWTATAAQQSNNNNKNTISVTTATLNIWGMLFRWCFCCCCCYWYNWLYSGINLGHHRARLLCTTKNGKQSKKKETKKNIHSKVNKNMWKIHTCKHKCMFTWIDVTFLAKKGYVHVYAHVRSWKHSGWTAFNLKKNVC